MATGTEGYARPEMLASSLVFSTIFSALRSPASVTAAVPCWPSCHAGIVISARSRSKMAKPLGLARSAKLIPPAAETRTSGRILQLVYYLQSIQEK